MKFWLISLLMFVSGSLYAQDTQQLDEIADAAAHTYGVPAEILKSIAMIETRNGANTGNHYMLMQLRSRPRLRKHITAFMKICNKLEFVPDTVKGSKAGALGIVQLMPLEWQLNGIDADNDGKVNPWNVADAYFTLANYLRNHGWDNNPIRAIYSLNHAWSYVMRVIKLANQMRE